MDEELKKKIEALLFSIGRKVSVDEILKMLKEKDKGKVVACLIELKNKYNNDPNNSLMILQDGDEWKLTIKDDYVDIAKEIGVETELTKTVMETLAVIAYKNPVLQSEVIKIRTNKAYDHLNELEALGYIQREKFGRTKKIKLMPKFFDYFDLPPESLKEKFANVSQMEEAIKNKEQQIQEIKEMNRQKLEQQKKQQEEMAKKNIFMESQENPIIKEVIEETKQGIEIIKEERLGNLIVVDEPLSSEEAKEVENQNHKEDKNKYFDLEVVDEQEEDVKTETLKTDEIKQTKTDDSEKIEEEIRNMQELKEKINELMKNNPENNSEQNNDMLGDKLNKDTDNNYEVNISDDFSEKNLNDDENTKKKYNNNFQRHSIPIEITIKSEMQKSQNIAEKKLNKESFNDQEDKDIQNEENNSDKNQKDQKQIIQSEYYDDVFNSQSETNSSNESILKEEKIFPMDGIPESIMKKIDEKAKEILGENKKQEKKNKLEDM